MMESPRPHPSRSTCSPAPTTDVRRRVASRAAAASYWVAAAAPGPNTASSPRPYTSMSVDWRTPGMTDEKEVESPDATDEYSLGGGGADLTASPTPPSPSSPPPRDPPPAPAEAVAAAVAASPLLVGTERRALLVGECDRGSGRPAPPPEDLLPLPPVQNPPVEPPEGAPTRGGRSVSARLRRRPPRETTRRPPEPMLMWWRRE